MHCWQRMVATEVGPSDVVDGKGSLKQLEPMRRGIMMMIFRHSLSENG